MGCYKGRTWVSLGGIGHVELSEGFFGLTIMDDEPIILLLYVDDLFLKGNAKQIVECKKKIVEEFEMKDLGLMHYFSMLKKSASTKSRQESRIQLVDNIGEKIGKIEKSRQTLKNTKYIHFFKNFKHLKQQ